VKSIFFNARPEASPEKLEALVRELRARPDVREAGALRPGAQSDALRRMFYATLGVDSDADALVQELNQRMEVESASLPADRHLAE